MARKTKILCSKALYERLIDATKSYHENGVCFLGKNYYTCPGIKDRSLTCDRCLRQNIIRIEKEDLAPT